jgi:hypothetical protein
VIIDEARDLYHAWGLGIGSTWYTMNPKALWSAWKLGTEEGIWYVFYAYSHLLADALIFIYPPLCLSFLSVICYFVLNLSFILNPFPLQPNPTQPPSPVPLLRD